MKEEYEFAKDLRKAFNGYLKDLEKEKLKIKIIDPKKNWIQYLESDLKINEQNEVFYYIPDIINEIQNPDKDSK